MACEIEESSVVQESGKR